jgi:hypothetical protein
MSSNENDIIPILLRFSNWRRSTTERQLLKGYKMRERNVLEIYTFNFLPCALTSTILAPLNRLKIIFQVHNMIPALAETQKLNFFDVVKTIQKEQGLLSLFKGNIAYTFKIFAQITSKTILIDRFKNKAKETKTLIDVFKYKILGANLIIDLFTSLMASFTTLLISYPYDLAYTRLAGLYTVDPLAKQKFQYKTIKQALHNVEINPEHQGIRQNSIKLWIDRHYWGFSLAFFQVLVFSTISLTGYQILFRLQNNKKENNSHFDKYMTAMGGSAIVALAASLISYPFDTIKRIYQVNGSRGYKWKYRNSDDIIKEVKVLGLSKFYNGFSFYLLRNIPFSYIQYMIFQSLTNYLTKN